MFVWLRVATLNDKMGAESQAATIDTRRGNGDFLSQLTPAVVSRTAEGGFSLGTSSSGPPAHANRALNNGAQTHTHTHAGSFYTENIQPVCVKYKNHSLLLFDITQTQTQGDLRSS